MYVRQLDSYIQKAIEKELKKAITETGLYSIDEIKEHVERGMDSKVTDIEDTINIHEIISERESEIDIDDVDDSIWDALIKVDKITGIGADYDKANHSELVMDIRYMIASRLEEEKKYISSMEKPSKKESKKNHIDLDL